MAWTAYGVTVLYVAINIPVLRALSTPLTWTMWRAARGPLADSARHHVNRGTAPLYLGLYGAAPMPHLAALARFAIVFDNAYAVYPESIKGLFSILCSTYPAFDSGSETYASVPCPHCRRFSAGVGTALDYFTL